MISRYLTNTFPVLSNQQWDPPCVCKDMIWTESLTKWKGSMNGQITCNEISCVCLTITSRKYRLLGYVTAVLGNRYLNTWNGHAEILGTIEWKMKQRVKFTNINRPSSLIRVAYFQLLCLSFLCVEYHYLDLIIWIVN